MDERTRHDGFDNLRACVLICGVFYHAALAYSPFMANLWFTANGQNHVLFDVFIHWLHLFRMPVFFVISGFFAYVLLNKQGNTPYFWHRTKRILLPFILFLPLLLVAVVAVLQWIAHIAIPTPTIFGVLSQLESPRASSMHLWFLWNLYGISLLFLLFMQCRGIANFILDAIVTPIGGTMVFILSIVPALYSQYVPFPAPDKFDVEIWSYGFYGMFFLFGAGLAKSKQLLITLQPFIMHIGLVAVGTFTLFFMMLPPALNAEQVLSFAKMGEISVAGLSHLLLVLVQAVSCISWVLVLLLWMQTHLNVHSVIGRYCSDASYWIYLVHFPVLLLVQAPLTQIQLPVFIEFAMSSLITLCLCFMSYHYLVRFSFVGKLLNGRKVSIASNRYR